MKASSIIATRRPVSRLVFGRVAVLALGLALALLAWHQRPAIAQTASQAASSHGDSKNLPLEFWTI